MTKNNLKLWTCYPKKIETFNNSSDDDCDNEEYLASETYDNASEDFENIPNKSWKCVASNNIENFQTSDYEIQQNLEVTTTESENANTEAEGTNTESEGVNTEAEGVNTESEGVNTEAEGFTESGVNTDSGSVNTDSTSDNAKQYIRKLKKKIDY